MYLNNMFKVQGGTADGDSLSLPVGEGILLSLGWSIWLQVHADSISEWVSHEYRGLSGVCRSQRSCSGIHKHLLKRSAGAAELHTIRGAGERTEEPDVRRDVGHKQNRAKLDGKSCHPKCVFSLLRGTQSSQNVALCAAVLSSPFYAFVLTGVKCCKPNWPHWIFVKISVRKAHVLWGRFTAIITKRFPLHLPHANWWQANRQHAPKTTVPLCWHCCRSLAAFFFFF